MYKVILCFLRARPFSCSKVAHNAILLPITPSTHVAWPCLGLLSPEARIVGKVPQSFVPMIVQKHVWLLHSILTDGSLRVKRNLSLVGWLRSV